MNVSTALFTHGIDLPMPAFVGRLGPSTMAFSEDHRLLVVHTTLGVLTCWDLDALGAALDAALGVTQPGQTLDGPAR